MRTTSSKLLMSMHKKGFTLVELLVVLTVVGLLASVALLSLESARTNARNAQVKTHVSQVRNALSLYEIGHNEVPSSQTVGCSQTLHACIGSYSDGTCTNPDVVNALLPYIDLSGINTSEKYEDEGIVYEALITGQGYVLRYFLEEEDECGNDLVVRDVANGIWCQNTQVAYGLVTEDIINSPYGSCGFVGTSGYEIIQPTPNCSTIHIQSNGGADIIDLVPSFNDSVRAVVLLGGLETTGRIRVGSQIVEQYIPSEGLHIVIFGPLEDRIYIQADEFDIETQIIP